MALQSRTLFNPSACPSCGRPLRIGRLESPSTRGRARPRQRSSTRLCAKNMIGQRAAVCSVTWTARQPTNGSKAMNRLAVPLQTYSWSNRSGEQWASSTPWPGAAAAVPRRSISQTGRGYRRWNLGDNRPARAKGDERILYGGLDEA
jgi:hypothetical protein